MGHTFKEIKIPDPGETGLSEPQRDKLLIEMAGGVNFLGGVVRGHCKTIEEHVKEIYGHKSYAGIKADVGANKERSILNRKRIWYIITVLIASGVAVGVAVPRVMGG